ncbi:hypothetical protein E5K00_01550 [Hymenobacter aquaticus]|uniref:Carbonic anhydrase n=1 Tax=Hymenobacter aquaticus TaxID=1867101 RepID=A0A4Z0Q1S2_9BACT|nr:hypothetical protein [Hymenobacter aquaticus]TGE23927.1 hypothetical protein E5K00_01550 [Hymenobacter aquaticus]
MPHSYPPPRGTVLLLSCMDLRLLDETVQFMASDNLINRYDQFILAGCALGADVNQHWEEAFFDHLDVACKLHNVEDVYLLEHRNCGAYRVFLGENGDFDDSDEAQAREQVLHTQYARKLTEKIHAWGQEHGRALRVRSFLMDLRGHVELLS